MLQPATVMGGTRVHLCAAPSGHTHVIGAAQPCRHVPCIRRAAPSVRAASQDDSGAATAQEQQSARGARRSSGFAQPDDAKPQPMRLERVERLGEEVWSRSGIAGVDRGAPGTSLGRAALLVGGDAAAVLLFAAIGRGSHAELNGVAGVLNTAWPFLAGWYAGASVTGAYGPAAQGREAGAAAGAAAKAWAIGIPLALALRSASKGAPPPLPFVCVASVATAVLLVGWRTALAAAASKATPRTGNRSGGPLEFLSLLGGLTKRW